MNKSGQLNGDHEVHKNGCSFMPQSENRIYLGDFTYCSSAVTETKKCYTQLGLLLVRCRMPHDVVLDFGTLEEE